MTEPVIALDHGAMIWSPVPDGDPHPPLLVMLHGRGGVERDLAQNFPALPDALQAVALRAPFRLGDGWTWFDYQQQDHAVFDAAARGVLAWVDTLPAYRSIGLFGFSLGGAMAVQLMRHAPRRFAYAVHLSAFVMPDAVHTDAELLRVRPPVLTGHGVLDDVIEVEGTLRGLHWLRRHTTLTEHTYPNVAHELSHEMLRDASLFVSSRLSR